MPSLKSLAVGTVAGGAVVFGGLGALGAIGQPGADRATVVKIVDGDTLDVSYDGDTHRVRLLNVDTPETKDPGKAVECLGPEATAYLEQQLQPGDRVRLEFDQELLDRYGRELAGVFVGDVLINAEIARAGLGVPVVFEPNRKFLPPVEEAYAEAKDAGVGMFSTDLTCTFEARIDAYAEQVTEVESLDVEADPVAAQEAADGVGAEAVALLAIIDAATPGSLDAAGLNAAELDMLRSQVVGLQGRAQTVSEDAAAEIERAEKEAAEKKAEEARKKAEEEARKAEEDRKAAKEAERQAAEQAEADRRAAEQAEADRRAAEQQSQIQPFAPQPEPAPQPTNVYYPNCAAARAAGAAPVHVGQPGYGTHLDRDRDGVGCE